MQKSQTQQLGSQKQSKIIHNNQHQHTQNKRRSLKFEKEYKAFTKNTYHLYVYNDRNLTTTKQHITVLTNAAKALPLLSHKGGETTQLTLSYHPSACFNVYLEREIASEIIRRQSILDKILDCCYCIAAFVRVDERERKRQYGMCYTTDNHKLNWIRVLRW